MSGVVTAGPMLSRLQLSRARDTLVSAYISWGQLDELAAVALDIDLEAEVGNAGGLKEIAYNLLKLTQASGTTEMLLREAVARKPMNPALAKLAREMGLAPAPFTNVILGQRSLANGWDSRAIRGNTAIDGSAPAALEADGYEAMVRPGGTEKAGEWRRTMVDRERPICQILFDGDPIGTGFLIACDLIMSNHHVFEMPGAGGQLGPLDRYSARFDYRASDAGTVFSPGIVVGVDKDAGYLDKSPKSECDYAIVRLAQRTGEDVMPGDKPRGWLSLDSEKLAVNDPAFVLQHPRGRTLELAVGVITGWEADRIDQVYEHLANTDEGSSGSPCFSWRWALRALHHRVDPKTGKVNRAIATAAILERMKAVGTIGLLP